MDHDRFTKQNFDYRAEQNKRWNDMAVELVRLRRVVEEADVLRNAADFLASMDENVAKALRPKIRAYDAAKQGKKKRTK